MKTVQRRRKNQSDRPGISGAQEGGRVKWYRTEPRINRQLTDCHKGWLEAVADWWLGRWNAYLYDKRKGTQERKRT